MLPHLRAAATLLGILTVLLGLLYPLAMTALAGALMPSQASGSLVSRNGQPVGSRLIGQSFTRPEYLQPRPSAAGSGYDASASSGTNLAPTSAKLAERLRADGGALRAETGAARLPADAITTSGSGLDPDVSHAFADLQVPRIAQARGAPEALVRDVMAANTSGRTFGVLGEPRVNVLQVNLALDERLPLTVPATTPASASIAPAGQDL